ncbi:NADH:flavin oxidoreductase/NADH oxidase [Streptomyces sp. NPDC051985]|uniref:NADH:flavin oxidoreductase/NADH oxidase n=1 Tax=Streptomyces sp. NPDC051985 TaxID=3155807 RepID=UPI003442E6EC
MSSLFEPLTLRSLSIPNRAWMSPMCQYSAASDGPDAGVPTDWHFAHLAARSLGGVGLIMVESTAVSPEARISTTDLGLWNDRQVEMFSRVNHFLADQGTVPGVQLGHAGRKASTDAQWLGARPVPPQEGGWPVVGPTAEAVAPGYPVPAELTAEQIRGIVADFAAAARRALAAGFKVVEVHGAHGYLIHSFLSPHTNRRTDGYGGGFAGRARLALEIVEAVRSVWPDGLPVFFRTSATDWLTENPEDERTGWTVEDTITLTKELAARGVDLVDVSTGGLVPDAVIRTGPGYQVPFAEQVKRATGMPVATVGEITEPAQAERIVASGTADAVLLGRELLRDADWVRRAAVELGVEPTWPVQYGWAV